MGLGDPAEELAVRRRRGQQGQEDKRFKGGSQPIKFEMEVHGVQLPECEVKGRMWEMQRLGSSLGLELEGELGQMGLCFPQRPGQLQEARSEQGGPIGHECKILRRGGGRQGFLVERKHSDGRHVAAGETTSRIVRQDSYRWWRRCTVIHA